MDAFWFHGKRCLHYGGCCGPCASQPCPCPPISCAPPATHPAAPRPPVPDRADVGGDLGQGAQRLGFGEVAREAHLIAHLGGLGADPGIGRVGQHLAADEGLDAARLEQRDLLAAARGEVARHEGRHVVEGLACCCPQGRVLLLDLGGVKLLLGLQHPGLGGLQHRIQPPQHRHRQDHVRILAALEQIAQHVVGDAPQERHDPVVDGLVHPSVVLPMAITVGRSRPAALSHRYCPARPRVSGEQQVLLPIEGMVDLEALRGAPEGSGPRREGHPRGLSGRLANPSRAA